MQSDLQKKVHSQEVKCSKWMKAHFGWLSPWLELVRLPNLFTVFGDPLMGASLAVLALGAQLTAGRVVCVCLASLFLYGYGVILNDWVDAEEDAQHRPERPIPSGRISRTSALVLGIFLALCGVVFAGLCGNMPCLISLVLVILITASNLVLKTNALAGAVGMGLCRAMNVAMGASLAGVSMAMLFPILGTGVFIALVTLLAAREERVQHPQLNVFLPALAFVAAWLLGVPCVVSAVPQTAVWQSLIFLVVAVALSWWFAVRVYNQTVAAPDYQAFIGKELLCLLPWQFAWVMLACSGHFWQTAIWCAVAYVLARVLAHCYKQS